MYLSKSISYLFQSLLDSIIDYRVYIFIIICSLLLLILLLYKSKIIKYIVLIINIISTILILINYNYKLFSINTFNYFIYNIYFYFLNSIIFMIISTIMIFKDKYYKFSVVVYIIHLIFITFSIFMTFYLNNNHYIVLINIYPEIVLGNIIYIIYYIIILIPYLTIIKLFDNIRNR